MRAQTVIAGIGHTTFGKLPDRSVTSMNVEACRNALADAGVDKDDVDGIFVKYPTSQHMPMYGQTMAEALGITPRIGGVWDQGGAANISMIAQAAMAIHHGQCEVALVMSADNPRTGTRQAYEKSWSDDDVYGWMGTAGGYAMIARRHMEEFGTTHEQLGHIAIAARTHALNNPAAQLQVPLDEATYAESPWVADPLRRDDCCLISDGGAAVVVMSADRARREQVDGAVPILGFGHGQTSWDLAQRPTLTTTAAATSARTAFAMAGVTPARIDTAQLYDCFTIAVLMTLEDYGFCAKGEGGKFVEDGRLLVGGDLPLNTSGGLLSETGMPGMQLIMEGVRQIRGTSSNQVNGATTTVVSNQGGIMHTHATLVLGS